MLTDKNCYRILEIPVEADAEIIKQAYRRLVKIWHPDLHGNSPECVEKLKEINEAYEILSDPTSRKIYNQTIRADEPARAQTSAPKPRHKPKNSQTYDSRSNDEAKKYYSEFERIINENNYAKHCTTFTDKLNILFGDLSDVPVFGMITMYPVLLFAAIFWHGCDVVSDWICMAIDYKWQERH